MLINHLNKYPESNYALIPLQVVGVAIEVSGAVSTACFRVGVEAPPLSEREGTCCLAACRHRHLFASSTCRYTPWHNDEELEAVSETFWS